MSINSLNVLLWMQKDHPAPELTDHQSAIASQFANHIEEIQGSEQCFHGVGDNQLNEIHYVSKLLVFLVSYSISKYYKMVTLLISSFIISVLSDSLFC